MSEKDICDKMVESGIPLLDSHIKIKRPFTYRLHDFEVSYTFTDELTVLENIYVIWKKLIDVVKTFEDLEEIINAIIIFLEGEGLGKHVIKKLEEWLADGTLEELINEALFNSKADKEWVEEELAKMIERLDTTLNQIRKEMDELNKQVKDEMLELDKKKLDKVEYIDNRKIDVPLTNNSKVRIIGDSIARGSGTENFTGLMKTFKEKYEGIDIKSYGVSSASLCKIDGRPHVWEQVHRVEADTTHLIIYAGINDVTSVSNDRKWYIGYPRDPYLEYPTNRNTSIDNLARIIEHFKELNPNMKIIYAVSGTSNITADFIKDTSLDFLSATAHKYSVSVVDMRKVHPFKWSPFYSTYTADNVHPNEKGYEIQANYLISHINNNLSDGKFEYPNIYFTDDVLENNSSYTAQIRDLQKIVSNLAMYKKYVDNNTVNVVSLNGLVEQWVVQFSSVTTHMSGIAYPLTSAIINRKIYTFHARFDSNSSVDVSNLNFSYSMQTVPLLNDYNDGYYRISHYRQEGVYTMRKDRLNAIEDMPQEIKNVNSDIVEIMVLSSVGNNIKMLVSIGVEVFIVLHTSSSVRYNKLT